MATNFPSSLDSLTNPQAGDTLANPSHSEQHANANDAIEALEAKVGVNSSAVTTSLDYKVSQLETNAVSSGLVDAKGDLIVGTADNTVSRLAVGTNGYGLVADSAQASGLKWAAVGDVTTTGYQTLSNKFIKDSPATERILTINYGDGTGTIPVTEGGTVLVVKYGTSYDFGVNVKYDYGATTLSSQIDFTNMVKARCIVNNFSQGTARPFTGLQIDGVSQTVWWKNNTALTSWAAWKFTMVTFYIWYESGQYVALGEFDTFGH